MMRSRIKNGMLVAGIWLVVVVSASIMWFFVTINNTTFTTFNKVARDDENIYVTENGPRNGLVWKLSEEGRVEEFFSSSKLKYLRGFKARDIDYANGNLRAIFERKKTENGQVVSDYTIVIFNEQLKPTFITAPFRFDSELILTGFTSTEDRFYITAVPVERKSIYVYRVYSADMIQLEDRKPSDEEINNWEKSKVKLSTIEEAEAESGRMVAEAEYDESELHIRYDNAYPEYFNIDAQAGNLFNRFSPTLYQYIEMSGLNLFVTVVIAIIGADIFLFVGMLLANRNRIVYVVGIAQLLSVVILGAFFGYHVYKLEQVRTQEYFKFASEDILSTFDGYAFTDIGSAELYVSRDYSIITERQNRMISKETTYDHEPDIMDVLVTDDTGEVVLSGSGNNLATVAIMYGSDARNLVKEALATGRNVKGRIVLDGENVYLIATPLSKAGINGYAGLVVARYDTIDKYFVQEYGLLLLGFVLIYFIISIIVVLVHIEQDRDLSALAGALERLSRGEENIEKPSLRGRDTNFMWNSIYEIQKNILNVNRAKFETYEAYYRFAPKGVENILGKQSIHEVKLGDSIDIEGTIAHVATEKQLLVGNKNQTSVDRFLKIMYKIREEYNGIFIYQNNTLSVIKILFLNNIDDAALFGTEFLLKLREKRNDEFPETTVILHYTPLSYGVVGSDKHLTVYMVSKDTDILQSYAEWFRKKKVSLILTETVLKHEKISSELRYIGFILPNEENPEERINLYEALDAESVAVHTKRIATKERFEEALELFYKQDYYIARNTFTEILRESPDDEISKWYLFECERYLNEAAPENFIGALHM